LFVSPLLAMPKQHGGCVYPHAVLQALHAAGLSIDYAWLAWPLRSRRAFMRNPLQASYVRKSYVPGTWQLGQWRMRAPSEWWPQPSAPDSGEACAEALPGPAEQAFIRQLIQRTGIRTILIDFASTLPVLDTLSPSERAQLHVAVLTHNLNSRRTELYQEHGQPLDFLPMTAAEEASLLDRADTIVAIQEREAEAFRSMLPRKTVVTVPIPVCPEPLPASGETDPVCLFVGGYSGHNLAGLAWLLREVWPRVLRECPDARLDVAGTVADAVPDGTPGVCRVGPVEDLRDAYSTARIALAPLPMGTGLKIKVIEAMGWGRPVVTTSAGAEGFAALEQGWVAVVADSPDDFAAAVVRLLRSPDEWQQVVRRQLSWIEEYCTPGKAIFPLLEAWSSSVCTGVIDTSSPTRPEVHCLSEI